MTQYTLDNIIRGYLIAKGNDSLHEYPRALQAAIATLKDLNYDVSGVPNVEVLDVEEGGRATLPQDFIKLLRIGFIASDGTIIEIFSNNKYIVGTEGLFNGTTNGLQSASIGTPMTVTPTDYASTIRNGQSIGRWYGAEGGSIYQYRLDWDRGVIEFSSNVGGQVILEYLGDPKKVGPEYMVHPFLVDALEYGIHYRMMKFKRSYAAGEKQVAHNEYLNAKHHARVRFASESIASIVNASRRTFNGSAKY